MSRKFRIFCIRLFRVLTDEKDQLEPSKAYVDCLEQVALSLLIIFQVKISWFALNIFNPLRRKCVIFKSERGFGHQVGQLFGSGCILATLHMMQCCTEVVFPGLYVCFHIFFSTKNKLFCLRKESLQVMSIFKVGQSLCHGAYR